MRKLEITLHRLKRALWFATIISSLIVTLLLGTPTLKAPAVAQDSISQSAIDRGIAAYDAGQLADAIALWQTAIAQSTSELTTAYLLSNIATAQQQLGQQQPAQAAIAQAANIVESWPEQDQTYWEISARVLNTKGQIQWQQGQTQAAFTTWQQAEQHYQQSSTNAPPTHPQSGLILTQINQAIALQELGLNVRAVQKLIQLGPQIETLPPDLKLSATAELGKALRQVGELSSAESVLSNAIAPVTQNTSNSALNLQLELANTTRAISHRVAIAGERALAQTQAEQTLTRYANIAQNTTNSQLRSQAQLNQLSYLIETGQLAQAAALSQTIAPPPITNQTSLEIAINYARSLNCLQSPANCIKQEWQAIAPQTTAPTAQRSEAIANLLTASISAAQTLQNPVLESYATGELGHLYEISNQKEDALQLTERSIGLLEGRQSPEIAYQWEWQLGRLYRDSNSQQAIAAYQQAIRSLAAVRQNLIAIDAQVQFSFLDNVEPVYRELASLLLEPSEPSQADLQLVVNTIDALQLTELENFLGCNLSALVNISETSTDPNALEIHPIILSDRLAIITEVAGQPLQLQTVSVSQTELDSTLANLRANLTLPGRTPQVIEAAAQLYDWLIAPIAPTIASNEQIETLVFVPDGLLRNIPLGVLYDGQEYLIEKGYALAIAPQLNLFAPAQNDRPLRILTGGVSLAQTIRGQAFSTIEFLNAELEQIPDQYTVSPPLLNEAFTQDNLEARLSSDRYTAIHWKTHGVFSSIPSETFLVAYQDGITANELSALVRSASQQQAEPLELVVLSACETAQGDRRAILGLAGIAVRAGSRSTLSTLWRADDGANTQLMDSFYQGLQNGLSKAQSLQNAQQTLLTNGGYPAPYYWAPYVLVGNWL